MFCLNNGSNIIKPWAKAHGFIIFEPLFREILKCGIVSHWEELTPGSGHWPLRFVVAASPSCPGTKSKCNLPVWITVTALYDVVCLYWPGGIWAIYFTFWSQLRHCTVRFDCGLVYRCAHFSQSNLRVDVMLIVYEILTHSHVGQKKWSTKVHKVLSNVEVYAMACIAANAVCVISTSLPQFFGIEASFHQTSEDCIQLQLLHTLATLLLGLPESPLGIELCGQDRGVQVSSLWMSLIWSFLFRVRSIYKWSGWRASNRSMRSPSLGLNLKTHKRHNKLRDSRVATSHYTLLTSFVVTCSGDFFRLQRRIHKYQQRCLEWWEGRQNR